MTTDPGETPQDRVLSYVRHNAEKDPQTLRGFLQQKHELIIRTIARLSAEQAAFSLGEGEWSILQVLAHVERSKIATAQRCVALAKGETPEAYDGDDHGEPKSTITEARVAVELAHGEIMAFLENVGPEINLETTISVGDFGTFNCMEVAVFQRVHDDDHLGQISGIMEAKGFPAAA